MPRKGVSLHFIAFLANVDRSILTLGELGGCDLREIPLVSARRLLSRHLGLPEIRIESLLRWETACVRASSESVFVAVKSMDYGPEVESYEEDRRTERPRMWFAAYYNRLIEQTKLLRLCRDGNICVPLNLAYGVIDGEEFTDSSGGTYRHVAPVPFTVEDEGADRIRSFLNDPQLKLDLDYISLARDYFELAYQLPRVDMAFLSLMIGMEVLFTNSRRKVTDSLARRTATLLAGSPEERDRLEARMRTLYDLRSRVIHRGSGKDVNDNDAAELRGYLRRSLVHLAQAGVPKLAALRVLSRGLRPDPVRHWESTRSRTQTATPSLPDWLFPPPEGDRA